MLAECISCCHFLWLTLCNGLNPSIGLVEELIEMTLSKELVKQVHLLHTANLCGLNKLGDIAWNREEKHHNTQPDESASRKVITHSNN